MVGADLRQCSAAGRSWRPDFHFRRGHDRWTHHGRWFLALWCADESARSAYIGHGPFVQVMAFFFYLPNLLIVEAFIRAKSAASPEDTATLRRGIGGEPGTLDPGAAADSFSLGVLGDLYEGLTAESADGTVVPGVAASWTVDRTGAKYEFNLRHDAHWSNGAPDRAQDFVNAWRRVVDPKQGSSVADNLRVIMGAEAIIAGRAIPSSLGVSAPRDDLLDVVLTRPAPYFPQLLTHYSTFPVFSESAARSHDARTWVSNGAYVLTSWTPGGTLQLSKNQMYWDRDHVPITNVVYVPLSDENAEWLRYRAGELDLTQSVPASALASIRKERLSELHIAPVLGTMYYAFNLHAAPFKNNVELREALVMAVDRRAILTAILPFGQKPAYGFVPNGTWNYQSQSWDWADTPDAMRIGAAQRSYAKAGYSRR